MKRQRVSSCAFLLFAICIASATATHAAGELVGRTRVLLISSLPGWEYRYLSQAFTRDESIDISCWLQSAEKGRKQAGNTPIASLPETADALSEFDVVLLFDPDP